MPPLSKPLFCPPVTSVVRSSQDEVPSKPKAGEIGWQEEEGSSKRMETQEENSFPAMGEATALSTTSSSQLSSMLDKIISDIKEKRSNPSNQDCHDGLEEQGVEASTLPSLPPYGKGSRGTSEEEETCLPSTSTMEDSNTLAQSFGCETSTSESIVQIKKVSSWSSPKPTKGSRVSSEQSRPSLNKKVKQNVSKEPKKVAQQLKSRSSEKTAGKQNKLPRLPGVGRQRKGGGEDIKKALLTLQSTRTDFTWVMCSQEKCSKWRYLRIKDPSLVEERWECKDNPDRRYGDCTAPEQEWDHGLRDMYVENRFTVGSMVWAKIEGWPAWPAMVDDDPETGEFFWTGVRGGEWELKPTFYHVVFFDAKDKTVSRAWVLDSRVERMVVGDKVKGQLNGRLAGAVEMARKAGRDDLDTRRKKYCLAARFKGPWGSVWPDFRMERYLDDDSDNSEQVNEEEGCREMMEDVINGGNNNISLTHDESISEVLKVVEGTAHNVLNDVSSDGKKRKANTSIDSEDEEVTKAAKLQVASCSEETTSKETSPSNENLPSPTMNTSGLNSEKSPFTQEMIQLSVPLQTGKYEGENLVPSGLDKVVPDLDNLSPIKLKKIQASCTLKERGVMTPNSHSLQPPPSPAPPSLQPSNPGDQACFQTSTPSRKSLISPSTKYIPSLGGDCNPPTLPPVGDGPLNTTSGSTAFSADGSFMEL